MSKLTTCKSCKKEISKGVKSCPNCGKDNRSFFARHKIITGIATLLVLGIISAASSGGSDATTNADDKKVEATTSYASVTMDELTKVLSDNPLKASSQYKDAYLELTGKVSNIDAQGSYFSLKDSSDFSLIGTQIFIDKEFLSQVSELSIDQDVTVKVKIKDVGEVLGYSADLIEFVK